MQARLQGDNSSQQAQQQGDAQQIPSSGSGDSSSEQAQLRSDSSPEKLAQPGDDRGVERPIEASDVAATSEQPAASSSTCPAPVEAAGGVGAQPADADDDGGLWERLEARRRLWAAADQAVPEAFTVRLAGGAWCRRALGKDYDAFKGISCGEDVQRW